MKERIPLYFWFSLAFFFLTIAYAISIFPYFSIIVAISAVFMYFKLLLPNMNLKYVVKLYKLFGEVNFTTTRNDRSKIVIFLFGVYASTQKKFDVRNSIFEDLRILNEFRHKCLDLRSEEQIFEQLTALCKELEKEIIQRHMCYKFQIYFYNKLQQYRFKKHLKSKLI